jgi:DNA/RNA-binding domain of Phe-tRNA-synthetase-like protein
MVYFQYSVPILETFPTIHGGILLVQGVTNAPTPPALQALYLAEQEHVKTRLGASSLSEIPSLAAWRAAFRKFGVDPTQYRSACESLLRRLTKKGDIPSINTLVDIGNLVSIRYGLPIAIVDTVAIQGGLTVHFAQGNETFVDLHETATVHPAVGEVVFTDETQAVIARRWCWRQSSASAASTSTTQALITIEAQHAEGQATVNAAIADMLPLLQTYGGGNVQSAVLSGQQARFDG